MGTATNGQEACQLIEQRHPQIVLLDIQMPLLSGVELVEKLSYRNFQLVFITAYDRYALRAFEVRAIDYLLKPFDDEAFYAALDRAKRQVQMQKALEQRPPSTCTVSTPVSGYLNRISIRDWEEHTVVAVQDIQWIEAYDCYVKIRTLDRQYVHRMKMDDLEAKLSPQHFLRIHRSTIVRIDAIQSLQRYGANDYVLHLRQGPTFRVSRSRKEQVKARLGISYSI